MNKRERLAEIQKRRSNKSYCYYAENLGEQEEDFFVGYIEELLNPWKDASKELPEDGQIVVCKKEGYHCLCVYDEGICHFRDYVQEGVLHVAYSITHWMYIPEIQGE